MFDPALIVQVVALLALLAVIAISLWSTGDD